MLRIYIDFYLTIMDRLPRLTNHSVHVIGSVPSSKNIKTGNVHHNHIRHFFELYTGISDVSGQAGRIIAYPPLMIVIILLLNFHIRVRSVSQNTFCIQADRTPLQVLEFSLRNHLYYFQPRVFQNGLKNLLTHQFVLRHHLEKHIIDRIQLFRFLPDSGIITQLILSFHKYNMISLFCSFSISPRFLTKTEN